MNDENERINIYYYFGIMKLKYLKGELLSNYKKWLKNFELQLQTSIHISRQLIPSCRLSDGA